MAQKECVTETAVRESIVTDPWDELVAMGVRVMRTGQSERMSGPVASAFLDECAARMQDALGLKRREEAEALRELRGTICR